MSRPTRWIVVTDACTGIVASIRIFSCSLAGSDSARKREHVDIEKLDGLGFPSSSWTVRQAASTINSLGIAHWHFPQQAEYRNGKSRPKEYNLQSSSIKRLEDHEIATCLVLRYKSQTLVSSCCAMAVSPSVQNFPNSAVSWPFWNLLPFPDGVQTKS